MIQRIQSIYLLLATGALGSLFSLPLLTAPSNDPSVAVVQMADGRLNLFDNYGLLGLSALGIVLAFVAIFLYKNRSLQGKITGLGLLSGILLLVLSGIATQSVWSAVPVGSALQVGFGWAAPVLSIALLWLASRAIRKDEQKVRSMDRLR